MTRPVVGVIDINGQQGGRKERIYFKNSDGADPRTFIDKMKSYCYGRTAFFAMGTELVYARVSLVGGTPDKETIPLPYPLQVHPAFTSGGGVGDTIGPSNDDNSAIFQCFQLAASKWANHYYNFYPDNWVTAQRLILGMLPYFQPSADTGAVVIGATWGGSHLQLCQAFWRWIIQNTQSGKKIASTNYTMSDINDIIFRNITRHNIGRFQGQHRGRRPRALVS